MKGVFLSILFLLAGEIIFAQQEALTPLPSNPILFQHKGVPFVKARQAALGLPFADDFNQSGFYPDAGKWEDRLVFVNNTFGVKPPSLGVATFDGLDENGQPYSEYNKDFGQADKLTSLPIDLSSYHTSDNIYLSFYWQAGGLGEKPGYMEDYIVLEFLNKEGEWVEQLRIDAPMDVNDFRQEFAFLNEDFLYDSFQFRFVAFGNLAGATDHWNIDYVLLDKNRNPAFESSVADLAFVRGNTSYLKNYYQMPFRHFTDDMLNDTISVLIKNNFSNTVDIVDNYEVKYLNTNAVLKKYEGSSIDIPKIEFKEYQYGKVGLENVQEVSDTTEIEFRYFFETSSENNSPAFVRANNQIIEKLTFANTFAYDDGSAERTYRLVNYDIGIIAVKFHATIPDTLRAIRVYFPDFPNFSGSTKDPLFNVAIYSAIDSLGINDEVVYREELIDKSNFHIPEGTPFNGFAYYTFNPEVNDGKDYILVDGDFYIAIEQEKKNDVDIGFDLNTNHSGNMFYNVGNGWFNSQFPGSIMINAIMGPRLSGLYTTVKQNRFSNLDLKVYPNPAKDIIRLQVETDAKYSYQVFDISGKMILAGDMLHSENVDVSSLNAGVYFIYLQDVSTNTFGSAKFIKQ
ncbi:MAG: T9SS type A sorting domain-containing protein [Chitinophagales bacterium]|nr:T9SS type A sorting domain-containing protein [Chitinophagales bacterium]